ncbi:hypothetical protein AMTR_s00021p00236420 [Amborella trichopoda]|uniref:Uncharacterized protein n=1 Tax=Amborella trichopoda TaxID=13333 RepID=W1Q0S6_AMBTC|nr:hypothetical protein AMTR_s00021p00236420 [Amborella trichopoda]
MKDIFPSTAFNGNTVSIGRWCYHYNKEDHLVAFDMQREEAIIISVPKLPNDGRVLDNYGIVEREGRLAFVYIVYNANLELWILIEEEWVGVLNLKSSTEFVLTSMPVLFLGDCFIRNLSP